MATPLNDDEILARALEEVIQDASDNQLGDLYRAIGDLARVERTDTTIVIRTARKNFVIAISEQPV